MAADHFRSEGLEVTDARRRPRALRGGCRRPPRGARLRESVPAPVVTSARTCGEDPGDVQPGHTRARRAPTRALVAVNPYVFIVGSARSGTTLLQRMVDAHPQVAVVN